MTPHRIGMEQIVSTMSTADPTAAKTKEEMETAMMSELHRINSFHNDWPHTRHLPATRMAAAGFYYKGEGDRVTCAFCRGWLQDWDGNDDPMAEHAKHHTHCKFVLDKEDCCNIPLTSSELAERHNGTDTSEEANPELFDAFPTAGSLALPRPQQPVSLHMEDPDTRKSTFMYWPSHVQKNTDDLAEAGFYYSMIKDKVRCFSCFIELERWELSDIPWGEHARWSPDCLFLLQNKGRFYVDQVQKKQYVVDYINHLRREARRRGCHDTMIDEALRNDGFPFDTELDMENAVLALADQSDAQIGVEVADNPNDQIDTEGL